MDGGGNTGACPRIKSLAMKGAFWRGAFASFIILFLFGAITLVIFKGADLMQEGALASEHFFSFLLMTGLVAGSIGGMAAQFSALQRGLGAIESVMDIVDQEREVHDLNQEPVAVSLRRPITLEDIHFNYPQRPDVPVLQGFTMRVEPGQPSGGVKRGWEKHSGRHASAFSCGRPRRSKSATRTWPPWTCAGTANAWHLCRKRSSCFEEI